MVWLCGLEALTGMADLPLDATGHRLAFFNEDGVDQLVTMVVELATELWVVRERLYALEAVAEKFDLPLRSAIESFRPDAVQQKELADMRARMLAEIFRTLNREHRPARSAAPDSDE